MKEQAVCNQKDECQYKSCTSAKEHDYGDACHVKCRNPGGVEGATCQPVPLYRCTKASTCGVPECSAAENHSHLEPAVHQPRECGFLRESVACEPVPTEVFDLQKRQEEARRITSSMDYHRGRIALFQADLDALAAKAGAADRERKAQAERIMEEANGVKFSTLNGVPVYSDEERDLGSAPETMTRAVWQQSVFDIIYEELHDDKRRGHTPAGCNHRATARIVALPRIRD